MSRSHDQAKAETINFRVEPALKQAFGQAVAAEAKPAGQVLRDFMRAYVARHSRRTLETEARRQSLLVASSPDEAEVMHWTEDVAGAEPPC